MTDDTRTTDRQVTFSDTAYAAVLVVAADQGLTEQEVLEKALGLVKYASELASAGGQLLACWPGCRSKALDVWSA